MIITLTSRTLSTLNILSRISFPRRLKDCSITLLRLWKQALITLSSVKIIWRWSSPNFWRRSSQILARRSINKITNLGKMMAIPSNSRKLANPTPLAFLPFRLSWVGMHISLKPAMKNPKQWTSQILSTLSRERTSRRHLSAISTLMLCATRKSTGLSRSLNPKIGVSCTSPDWGATKGTLMIPPNRLRVSIFLLREKSMLLVRKKRGRQ